MTAPHEPTRAQRAVVQSLSGFGIPQAAIAKHIGVSLHALTKHYRHELDEGQIRANASVAESLYNKAMGDGPGAVTAAIFWCKTRLGWRETTNLNHSSEDGTMSPKERDADAFTSRVAMLSAGTSGKGTEQPIDGDEGAA